MTFYARNMNKRITIEPVTGKSAYGDRSYGAAVPDVPARVEYNSYVLVLDDEEILITNKLATEHQVKQYDRITLPGESVKRIVRRVKFAARLRNPSQGYYIVEVA